MAPVWTECCLKVWNDRCARMQPCLLEAPCWEECQCPRKGNEGQRDALHCIRFVFCESSAVCGCCPLKTVTTWDMIVTVLQIVGGLLGPDGAALKSSAAAAAEVGGGGAVRC